MARALGCLLPLAMAPAVDSSPLLASRLVYDALPRSSRDSLSQAWASFSNLGRGPSDGVVASSGGAATVSLKALDEGLVICNAFESKAPVLVYRGGQPALQRGAALRFGECAAAAENVRARDRISFALENVEGGMFEFGRLPEASARLLLVIRRRPNSSSLEAESFSFPQNSHGMARLAVVDDNAARDGATPVLVKGAEEQALIPGEVYAMSPGAYAFALGPGPAASAPHPREDLRQSEGAFDLVPEAPPEADPETRVTSTRLRGDKAYLLFYPATGAPRLLALPGAATAEGGAWSSGPGSALVAAAAVGVVALRL